MSEEKNRAETIDNNFYKIKNKNFFDFEQRVVKIIINNIKEENIEYKNKLYDILNDGDASFRGKNSDSMKEYRITKLKEDKDKLIDILDTYVKGIEEKLPINKLPINKLPINNIILIDLYNYIQKEILYFIYGPGVASDFYKIMVRNIENVIGYSNDNEEYYPKKISLIIEQIKSNDPEQRSFIDGLLESYSEAINKIIEATKDIIVNIKSIINKRNVDININIAEFILYIMNNEVTKSMKDNKIDYLSIINIYRKLYNVVNSKSYDLALKIQEIGKKKIVFIGKNGSGKSRYSKSLINEMRGNNNTFIPIPAVKPIDLHNQNKQASHNQIKENSTSDTGYLVNSLGARSYEEETSNYKLNSIYGEYDDKENIFKKRSSLEKGLRIIISEFYSIIASSHYNEHIKPKGTTKLEKLQKIFNRIFPNKNLVLNTIENWLYVVSSKDNITINNHKKYNDRKEDFLYLIDDMSDGEKTVLYLITTVLLAKENSIIIADEPETHLHKLIQKELWDILEVELDNKNSIIIYITHDLDFAVSRKDASYHIFKSYSSTTGAKLEKIENLYDDIPHELQLELASIKGPIIFCEGGKKYELNKNSQSLDKKIYQLIFDAEIVECGGCDEVIHAVKTLSNNKIFSEQIYGIVDLDDRIETDIEEGVKNGIYTLPVATIESLYINIEFIKALSNSDNVDCYIQTFLNSMLENTEKKLGKDNYVNYYTQKASSKIKYNTKNKKPWICIISDTISHYQKKFDNIIGRINSEESEEDKYELFLKNIRGKYLKVAGKSFKESFVGSSHERLDIENTYATNLINCLTGVKDGLSEEDKKRYLKALDSIKKELKNHFNSQNNDSELKNIASLIKVDDS